ncbi:hypothetical protein [Stappia sp.]|uniref:hypothetical protein n=1 Tax=Stappia sp. TaxID=1870903 RepID=UPI003A992592
MTLKDDFVLVKKNGKTIPTMLAASLESGALPEFGLSWSVSALSGGERTSAALVS